MAIPISTTTITVKGIRPQSDVDPDAEGYDAPAPEDTVLATDVRATITLPVGRRSNPTDAIESYSLRCDPLPGDIELTRFDVVLDQSTGKEYVVHVATKSLPEEFGLTHWVATLRKDRGIVSMEDTNEFARD